MFDPKDWDIETELDKGNDDFIYGNYVDWDKFRDDNEDDLLNCFCVNLPWGKSLTLREYNNFILQDIFRNSNLCQSFLDNSILIEETSRLLFDGEIKFITRDSEISNDLISNILDYYGVPSGQQFEHELPEHLSYWQEDFSDVDYDSYRRYPIKFEKYEQSIIDVFNKIDLATDPLIKKSLILSALIVTESMFKSVIVEKIPEDNEISKFGKEILEKEINKTLRGNNDGKNQLFKKLYNKNAPSQNWTSLRNSLAHDIESCLIDNNEIVYINLKNDEEDMYPILDLKQNLLQFWDNVKCIISY